MSDETDARWGAAAQPVVVHLASHMVAAQCSASAAQHALLDGTDADRADLDWLLQEVADKASAALELLETVGVRPEGFQGKMMVTYNLAALETLDTKDARALLALLEKAAVLAGRVDEQRGDILSAGEVRPGECKGTNWEHALHRSVLRLRAELYGPRGRE